MPGEIAPAVTGAQADRDHLRWYAAPFQFPDLADCVVLRTARASRQGISRRPDERYQLVLPTFLVAEVPIERLCAGRTCS
jgi:hypothetical protein